MTYCPPELAPLGPAYVFLIRISSMKIAIAGCGIAGTAVGHLLAQAGHEITIFEQATECRPIGAGIMLQPSGQAVLDRLGIKQAIADRSAPLDGLEAKLASGRPLIRLKYAALDPDCCAWGVHRGLLFDHLMRLCRSSGVTIETSSLIVEYSIDGDQVAVVTESGKSTTGFDFVIAADGSRSRLRDAAGIRCKTVEYPYAALWAIGPCADVNNCLYQVIDGTRRLVGLLPVGDGRCSFFWGLRADAHDSLLAGGIETWKAEVVELCPQATELLQTIESLDQLMFATYRHVRMRSWHADRIIFLGDAAHPSSPHLGQGVNLALEDAVCFADALASTDNFQAACEQYRHLRRRKLQYYQQLTRLLTPFFQSDSSILGVGRNIALPWFPPSPGSAGKCLTPCAARKPAGSGRILVMLAAPSRSNSKRSVRL